LGLTKIRRKFGSQLFSYGKRVAPPIISIGLVSWLIWSITPEKLAATFSTRTSLWLVLATAIQVVVLFTWDTVSLWWLFSQPHQSLPFGMVFRARADTIVWSAVNLEIGQGVFAWKLAQITASSVQAALGRCLVLALFDFGTLMSLALVGSFLKPDPFIRSLRWICVAAIAGLLVAILTLRFLPTSWRRWLTRQDWARWLDWWSWRHSLLLWGQRVILFLLVLIYAGVGLTICRIPVDARTVAGVIPFVLLAESLPGTAGLGERETALVYLLHVQDDQRAVVLQFGLTWSVVVILGRVVISLVSWWILPTQSSKENSSDERSSPVELTQRQGHNPESA